MKVLGIIVAASMALAPVLAAAQSSENKGQLVGVPPKKPVPELTPIPDGVAAGAALGILVIGAGVGIGLAGGGGGGGTTGTTSTTSTTTTN